MSRLLFLLRKFQKISIIIITTTTLLYLHGLPVRTTEIYIYVTTSPLFFCPTNSGAIKNKKVGHARKVNLSIKFFFIKIKKTKPKNYTITTKNKSANAFFQF